MSKDIKVTLGPSLAEKQKTIDILTIENAELTTQLEKLRAAYSEMEQRCYKYADLLLETKDLLK
jgi:hypothetical protein